MILACEMCFGAAVDSPVVYGISLAMLLLLGMTGLVWGGIVLFFGNMERRARLLAAGELTVEDDADGLDALLDKINREGYDSLTLTEQARLRALSD